MPFANWSACWPSIARCCRSIPVAADSTVGGVVAANLSGPRRRLYGTARDMIIGMTFATLEGKLINSGGMVVKNVAGLDMAKLMVGSFGTLAAIADGELQSVSDARRVAHLCDGIRDGRGSVRRARSHSAQRAAALRDRYRQLARADSGLLIRAGGNAAVLDRYRARTAARRKCADESVWDEIREFTPRFLAANPRGGVVPMAMKLSEMRGGDGEADGAGHRARRLRRDLRALCRRIAPAIAAATATLRR